MPPLVQIQDAISISDEDDGDSCGSDFQALSRDLEDLEQRMKETNEQIEDSNDDVTSYAKLLKTAEERLQVSRKQKEKLVDEKYGLVKRKQRLLERRARNRAIKLEARTPATASSTQNRLGTAGEKATVGRAAAASSGSESSSRAIGARSTQDRTTQGQTTHDQALATPDGTGGDLTAAVGGAVESQALTAPSLSGPRATEFHTTAGPTVAPLGGSASGFRAIGGQTTQGRTTQGQTLATLDGSRVKSEAIRSQALTAPSGLGAVEGQAVGSRTPVAPSASGRTPQRKAVGPLYSPYYEASNSDSEIEVPVTASQLVPGNRLNIPTNSKTFSRMEISNLIGGKTQGTWCTINQSRATRYKAGSYMALIRDLNHLLPTAPGLDGGIYVADWLKKEVGKKYHIFIKKSSNNWLYYGKYLISYIKEISLDEWKKFSPNDQRRWAEHLLEHLWGKNILVKKKVFKSVEHLNVGTHWKEVLRFFNQPDDLPHLRLKLLGLHFIAYDRDLYDNLESESLKLGRKD